MTCRRCLDLHDVPARIWRSSRHQHATDEVLDQGLGAEAEADCQRTAEKREGGQRNRTTYSPIQHQHQHVIPGDPTGAGLAWAGPTW